MERRVQRMTLQNRVKRFLEITEINKTKFCRNVGISITTLSMWLRGERDVNANTENRIISYMQNFTKQLIEIAT